MRVLRRSTAKTSCRAAGPEERQSPKEEMLRARTNVHEPIQRLGPEERQSPKEEMLRVLRRVPVQQQV